jgi:predicted phosphohydrolase
MRILITADLHYDVQRSRQATDEVARRICALGGDALVLVGDSAGADLGVYRQCLRLFAGFRGVKALVPGNHCLWCHNGETSIDRYERLIPAVAAEEGFVVLDHQPLVLGGVGLAGSIGWYDYSLRDERLGLPLAFYRRKLSPGAARYYGGYDELLAEHAGELTDRHYSLGVRWMDGWRCRLDQTDEEFLDRLCARLDRQLAELAGRVERIVAFVHHLPFARLVPMDRPDHFAFAAAYMGARRLGELLQRHAKVTDVFCGHSHWPGRVRLGGLNVINVGSTYREKYVEVLECGTAAPGCAPQPRAAVLQTEGTTQA